MTALTSRFTRLLHVAAPLALIVLTAGCLPSLPGPTVAATQTRSGATLRIGKSVRGDVNGVLAFAGEVRAKGQVAVIPKVTSQLTKYYVEVGSRVREGDPLADLDRTDLEQQVQQAQAAQAAAEARLGELKAGPKPEALALAQANQKAAQARVKALQTARQNAVDPAALQQRLADAQARLKQAQVANQPDEQKIAQADATLNQARTKLTQLLADPTRVNDRAAIEAARADQTRAEDAANAARNGGQNQAAVDRAMQDVQDAQQALTVAQLSASAFDLDQAQALADAADAQVQFLSVPASDDAIKGAQSAVEQAFALAEMARSRLQYATVTAPITGVVTEIDAQLGSTVGPTGPILVLIPPELQVSVQADEAQSAQIQVGQGVSLSVASLPQDAFAGVVKSIAPVLDPRTRTVAVNVEVPDPKAKLKPGMFAQLAIQTSQHQGAVLVPKDAVVRQSTNDASGAPQNVVFLVIDGRVKRQAVQVGVSDGKSVEITSGLPDGTDIVLTPRPDLVDGELINSAP